jgi:peptidylprolyl isomerase
MGRRIGIAGVILGVAAVAGAASAAGPTAQQVIEAAPASAWRDIAPEDLLVMTLGDGSRVILALAPAFAPVHVTNIRAFVRAGWFDGAAVVRVQDNYVVQWAGDAKDRPLPPGVTAKPPAEYEGTAGGRFWPLGFRDTYATQAGHVGGWPVATDGKSRWLVHCYGMVGVGRDMPPDTGNGLELYAVIGQAPRHLDRNITLVGRVIEGIDRMGGRPRGTEEMGFYKTEGERLPIVSTRIASDMPASDRPHYQMLDSDSATFGQLVQARANRTDTFFVKPAGAVDICNALPPVRKTP